MAIPVEAFCARFNEACTEAEQEILGALRTLNQRIAVLTEVAGNSPPEEVKAMLAYANERLDEHERRLLEGRAK